MSLATFAPCQVAPSSHNERNISLGETASMRRRRSNRPGNSQAKGPARPAGLWREAFSTRRLAEGITISGAKDRGGSLNGTTPCQQLSSCGLDPHTTLEAFLTDSGPLSTTPLHDLHLSLGARMVPFAGYDMPVQYQAGVLKEHLQTRSRAGLFDVSHMGSGHREGSLRSLCGCGACAGKAGAG